jgi:hypothetical protein
MTRNERQMVSALGVFGGASIAKRSILNKYQDIDKLITDIYEYIDFYNRISFHETLNHKESMNMYQKSIKLNQKKQGPPRCFIQEILKKLPEVFFTIYNAININNA